ncbi:hypothetical protein HMN09_01176600 [Mycena chlorophos]|uniref:Uncharacterized protein n=1 Tax=Mycena chlorophos TaxID=658473 RepID=A0A8H6VXI3_MYCCL|nr:hypothetical protein HMN09_01176600 [Mycena chlorophos]
MSGCANGTQPIMNTDISGPGVRISFYLQTLFLSCLFARSESLDELTGALYTLLSTNTAMAVTALILGFKPQPEISFHDALIVLYLLSLSGTAVFIILPTINKFPEASKTLRYFSVIQTYAILAFMLAVLIKADGFGDFPGCNHLAVIALFRPINALHAGRILCLVLAGLFTLLYTGLLIKDHLRAVQKKRQLRKATTQLPMPADSNNAPDPGLNRQGTAPRASAKSARPVRKPEEEIDYEMPIAWDVLVQITVITILWALAVMNTELLIRWSGFAPSDSSSWQFGQVLPMFLLVQPLTDLINAFSEHGIRPLGCEPVRGAGKKRFTGNK